MSELMLKFAAIVAVTILGAVGLTIYFGPYQTCVRAKSVLLKEMVMQPHQVAQVQCAMKD